MKRIGAYLIDYFIISLICMASVYISFLNPTYDEYIELSNEYSEMAEQYYNEEITEEELYEYIEDINYDLNKYGCVYIIYDIVIILLYFGLFNYFTKGQTLGKKLTNIRIVDKSNGNAKCYQYILRTVFLYSIIPNILILIGLCFKSSFNTISTFSSNFDSILSLIIIISIFITKDGRGLHDYIAGTKVIDLKSVSNTEEVVVDKNASEAEISEIQDEPIKKKKKKED